MKLETRWAAVVGALLCAVLVGVGPSTWAADDADQKKARKSLKKNVKKLAKIQKFLAKQHEDARGSSNAKVRDKAEETIETLCRDQLPDPGFYAECLQASFDELLSAAQRSAR